MLLLPHAHQGQEPLTVTARGRSASSSRRRTSTSASPTARTSLAQFFHLLWRQAAPAHWSDRAAARRAHAQEPPAPPLVSSTRAAAAKAASSRRSRSPEAEARGAEIRRADSLFCSGRGLVLDLSRRAAAARGWKCCHICRIAMRACGRSTRPIRAPRRDCLGSRRSLKKTWASGHSLPAASLIEVASARDLGLAQPPALGRGALAFIDAVNQQALVAFGPRLLRKRRTCRVRASFSAAATS